MPRRSHLSGRLVVFAIISLGLLLGVVALLFRNAMPDRPATMPTRPPSTVPR